MVSRSRVKQLITYYYNSGEVVNNMTGKTVTDHRIRVDGEVYTVRRLIWLYMTGEWFTGNIYLIEGNSTRWTNMTNIRPERERRVNSKNVSGVKGITYSKRDKRWSVSTYRYGKQNYIGSFIDKSEAVAAHSKAIKDMGAPIPKVVRDPQLPKIPQSNYKGVDWNLEYQRWFVTDTYGEYLGSSKRLDWAINKRREHNEEMFL